VRDLFSSSSCQFFHRTLQIDPEATFVGSKQEMKQARKLIRSTKKQNKQNNHHQVEVDGQEEGEDGKTSHSAQDEVFILVYL